MHVQVITSKGREGATALLNGKRFPWNMDMTPVSDQCGKNRAHDNHIKCSKQRKACSSQRRAQIGNGGNRGE